MLCLFAYTLSQCYELVFVCVMQQFLVDTFGIPQSKSPSLDPLSRSISCEWWADNKNLATENGEVTKSCSAPPPLSKTSKHSSDKKASSVQIGN